MSPTSVAFIGGRWPKFGSIQIRCIDMARYLGCAHFVNITRASEIPRSFNVFVCVKTKLPEEELLALSRRGHVIWDVIDGPPRCAEAISAFIFSTEVARRALSLNGNSFLIPHYHCNFSGRPSNGKSREPVWIGNVHWHPNLPGLSHSVIDVAGLSREDICAAYERAGIVLNMRARLPGYEAHAQLNSGIKLINSMGFGLPSLSENEPPYLEVGEDCTVFTSVDRCSEDLARLSDDSALYDKIRARCILRARDYHISAIAERYRELFMSL